MAVPTPPPLALSRADDDDLCALADLNATTLLELLQHRFDRQSIFTWAGPVLLSLNPFATIPGLFDKPHEWSTAWSGVADEDLPPHVFAIAERAWRVLLKDGTSQQAFIVNGESGAGKTEACRQLMRYIAEASLTRRRGSSHATDDAPAAGDALSLEQSMLTSSRVLEAFGNAKTIRNRNSSRFGKLTWLLFSEARALVGTQIEISLLEKSRLVAQGAGERNFHVFYQLCAAANAEGGAGDGSALAPAADWTILSRGGCLAIEGVDDLADFGTLAGALSAAGFGAPELRELWKLLGGLLFAGQLRFAGEGGSVKATIEDAAPLQRAASAFGCTADALETAVLERTVAAGLNSISTVYLSGSDAADARDALIKHIYQSIFGWLVASINQGAAAVAGAGSAAAAWGGSRLGLLDIYGFENLERNSLEQLCINYANELLQQQFNEITFRHELALYEEEGVDVSEITYKDNTRVIELIGKRPLGIFALLDEQGMLGERGSAEAFKAMLYSTHLGKSAEFQKPRFGEALFNVRHFAAEIAYDPAEFLTKNVDELTNSMALFLQVRS